MPKTRTPGVADAGRRLRLVAGGAEPAPSPEPSPPCPLPGSPAPYPPPEPGRPSPPPSVAFPPLGIEPGGAASLDLERQHLAGEVELTARCAALEHENRRLAGDVERARAAGERAERERAVRTMGHRLPSILTGGR